MDVTLVEAENGFHVKARGARVAIVDTSRNTIEIAARPGGLRSFAASQAGVDAAITTLGNICEWLQRGCAATSTTTAARPDFRPTLLEALRRSARARRPDVDLERVEAAVAAERAPQSATPLVYSSAFLQARYFAADVLRFRAAAIAAAHIERFADDTERVEVVDALGPKLEGWRTLFAPHGRVTRALHKTLTELSSADEISGDDVLALSRVRLERPVQSALHLKILAERARAPGKHRPEHLSMIQHAAHDELIELRSRVADALDLRDLSEADENHLLAEAIAGGGARERDERLGRLVERSLVDGLPIGDGSGVKTMTLTAPPPIPPPPGAIHLRTAGDVVKEGQRMHHCVGTHAAASVAGASFIFHYDSDGVPVTVEVDALGHVLDAAGRRNAKGPAVERARKLFEEWGARFPGR